jgi:hypothetical protein
VRRWPDPRDMPLDNGFAIFLLVLFAAVLVAAITAAVYEHRKTPKAQLRLHSEWQMTIDDHGNLVVKEFDGCGCPIGHDHYQDGEPKR